MNKFIASVRCAVNGIRYAMSGERNMRVHLAAFSLVMAAGLILQITRLEWLAIFCISALTFALELTNTAIERLADRVSPARDAMIGKVKDLMAGAVLVSVIFSVIIGLLIFYEPVLKLLSNWFPNFFR